jgi:SOS-response transcriptional repressor LexA
MQVTITKSIGGLIKQVRKSIGLTQIEFAKSIGTQQGVLTNWETGKYAPSSEGLVKIAALTEDKSLKRQLLEASGLAAFVSRPEPKSPTTGYPTLSIRLLRDSAAAGTPRMVDEREVERLLVLPKFMFPNAAGEIVAIRVKGDSMEPMILPGSIVFLDVSQREAKKLAGSMVAARVDGGVTIKFLRKSRGTYLLVPYHISPRHDVTPLSDLAGDAIIGRVLTWISEPPK